MPRTARTIRANIISSLVMGISVWSPHAYTDFGYTFEPIVLYALNTSHPVNTRLNHMKIVKGTFRYDDQYRRPDDSGAPIIMSCTDTRGIGITYLLSNPHKFRARTLTVTYLWWHSATGNREPHSKHVHTHEMVRGTTSIIVSEDFALTPEEMVNGVISVDVKVGPDVVMRGAFQFVDCSADNDF